MPRLVYPFDNPRLVTDKVIANLRDADQLPARRSDWPCALESRQAFIEKLARATSTSPIKLAPDEPFADSLNSVLGAVHGSGGDSNAPAALIESNFRDGVYKIGGSAVTLSDIWIEDTDWSNWTGYTITPGLGYVKQDRGPAANYGSPSDSLDSPTLAHGLFGPVINLTDGFTALLEGSFTWEPHDSDDGTDRGFNNDFGLWITNLPDFTELRECTALAEVGFHTHDALPFIDHFQGKYIATNDVEADDDQPGVPANAFLFRIAMTMEEGRFAYSLNGRPVVSNAAAPLSSPTDIMLEYRLDGTWVSMTSALEYVAFYPKFANDADLRTLTAPAAA